MFVDVFGVIINVGYCFVLFVGFILFVVPCSYLAFSAVRCCWLELGFVHCCSLLLFGFAGVCWFGSVPGWLVLVGVVWVWLVLCYMGLGCFELFQVVWCRLLMLVILWRSCRSFILSDNLC